MTDFVREKFKGKPIFEADGIVNRICWSPDGRFLAVGGLEVIILDGETYDEVWRTPGPDGRTWCLAFIGGGERFFVGGQGTTAEVRQSDQGQLIHSLEGCGPIVVSAFSVGQGKHWVTLAMNGVLSRWDLDSGQLLNQVTPQIPLLYALPRVGDETVVVAAGSDHAIHEIDLYNGSVRRTYTGKLPGISAITLSPDGGRVVAGNGNKILKVWDVVQGKGLSPFRKGHQGPISGVTFLPSGSSVCSVSAKNLHRFDCDIREERQRWSGFKDFLSYLAIHPAGKRLAFSSSDGKVYVVGITI